MPAPRVPCRSSAERRCASRNAVLVLCTGKSAAPRAHELYHAAKKMGIPDCRIQTTSGGGSCQRTTAWPVSCGRMAISSYSEISTMLAVSYIERRPSSLATRAHALRHETVVALLVDGLGRQFRFVTSTPPAEYQGAGAANFTMKSGGSKYHGQVSDFIRILSRSGRRSHCLKRIPILLRPCAGIHDCRWFSDSGGSRNRHDLWTWR